MVPSVRLSSWLYHRHRVGFDPPHEEASRDDDSGAFPIGSASLLIWEPQYQDLSVGVSPLLEDIQDMPRGNMKSEVILFEIPDPNDFFNRLL